MTWLLGLLAGFAFLGTRRREPRINVHLVALMMIVVGVAYAAVKHNLL